jgi:hypothetical protein
VSNERTGIQYPVSYWEADRFGSGMLDFQSDFWRVGGEGRCVSRAGSWLVAMLRLRGSGEERIGCTKYSWTLKKAESLHDATLHMRQLTRY